MPANPIRHETIEDFHDAEHGEDLLIHSAHLHWLAWETEDGEWFAVRPRNEEDPEGPDGDRWRPVVELVEHLAFPITVLGVVEAGRLTDEIEADQ